VSPMGRGWVKRSADFQVCCIAGFPTRVPCEQVTRITWVRSADWEIGDTAGLETCATEAARCAVPVTERSVRRRNLNHPNRRNHRMRVSRRMISLLLREKAGMRADTASSRRDSNPLPPVQKFNKACEKCLTCLSALAALSCPPIPLGAFCVRA